MTKPASRSAAIQVNHDSLQTMLHIRKGKGFQAIPAADLAIEYDCRKADCGICIFEVLEGEAHLSPPTVAEKDFLQAMHASKGERLACQCRIMGDIKIRLEDNKPIV